ncbi:MAG: alpha/beta fold hydrolase, partial [Ilumatobacter sp.]|nr:alpha/beta fold hydrolase [Ilumatobacter sp.]
MTGRTTAALAALTLAAMTMAACSSDPDADEAAPSTTDEVVTTDAPDTSAEVTDETSPTEATTDVEPVTEYVPEPIAWEEFDDETDVATLVVPVDYENPGGEQFELFVTRHRALDPDARIGSLLINPGGPGFGGSDYALFATQIFDRDLLEHFDIVGWDPRGTGLSEPAIDCIDDYDPYFTALDLTPDTDEEREQVVGVAANFVEACETNNADYYQYVGTNNSARDMDALRQALGEDTISYFGFS